MRRHSIRVLRNLCATLIAVAVALVGTLAMVPTANAATPKSTATAKEYKKVKKGQSLKKVRKIIGGKGENVSTGSQSKGSYVYLWRSTDKKDVYVRFVDGKVKKKKRVTDKTVSYAEEKKTKKGQSYSEIQKIVRAKAPFTGKWSDDYTQRTWCSSNGSDRVTGLFYKGKLADDGLQYVPWWDESYGAPTCTNPVY